MKTQMGVRVSKVIRKMLLAMCVAWDMPQTEVIDMAIKRLFEETFPDDLAKILTDYFYDEPGVIEAIFVEDEEEETEKITAKKD